MGVGRVLRHPLGLLHFGVQGTGGLLTSLDMSAQAMGAA